MQNNNSLTDTDINMLHDISTQLWQKRVKRYSAEVAIGNAESCEEDWYTDMRTAQYAIDEAIDAN